MSVEIAERHLSLIACLENKAHTATVIPFEICVSTPLAVTVDQASSTSCFAISSLQLASATQYKSLSHFESAMVRELLR